MKNSLILSLLLWACCYFVIVAQYSLCYHDLTVNYNNGSVSRENHGTVACGHGCRYTHIEHRDSLTVYRKCSRTSTCLTVESDFDSNLLAHSISQDTYCCKTTLCNDGYGFRNPGSTKPEDQTE